MLTGTDRRRHIQGMGMGDMGAVESVVWPTTGDLDTESRSLGITISTLGHDYAASSLTTSNDSVALWERSWNDFVTDFLQWQASPYFWNPTRRDQLLEYRRRFNALLDQYRGLGSAAQTFIAPVEGDHAQPDSLDKVMTAVKWGGLLLIGGGVLKLAIDSGLFKRRP